MLLALLPYWFGSRCTNHVVREPVVVAAADGRRSGRRPRRATGRWRLGRGRCRT